MPQTTPTSHFAAAGEGVFAGSVAAAVDIAACSAASWLRASVPLYQLVSMLLNFFLRQ